MEKLFSRFFWIAKHNQHEKGEKLVEWLTHIYLVVAPPIRSVMKRERKNDVHEKQKISPPKGKQLI